MAQEIEKETVHDHQGDDGGRTAVEDAQTTQLPLCTEETKVKRRVVGVDNM